MVLNVCTSSACWCLVVFALWHCAGRSTQSRLDKVSTFRASLADPGKYDVRDGLSVDEEAIKDALAAFGRDNREMLQAAFEESLKELPAGEPPGSGEFKKVVEIDLTQKYPELVGSLILQWVLFPEVEKVIQGGMKTVFPLAMREQGMTVAHISSWLVFLNAAKPDYSVCGRGEDEVTICADYGGLDVFVSKVIRMDYAWLTSEIAWWQRSGGKETQAGAGQEKQSPGAGFKVSGVEKADYGWEVYSEPIVLAEDTVENLAPGQDSAEAAVVHFYASKIRGDSLYLDVLPPKEEWPPKLVSSMERIDEWKFIEVVLMARKKQSETRIWIQIHMEVEENGDRDSGTDDVAVEKIGGKWFVVEPPS